MSKRDITEGRKALSDERRAFLRERMKALAAQHPMVRELERKLLAVGGEAVVFPPSLPPSSVFPFERIVRDGQVWRLRRARPGDNAWPPEHVLRCGPHGTGSLYV